ncbi:MAG: hypothetical protein IKK75_15700 [Clostridia bacterium]|nr:hypothetical protein [Clostridia bacterium]
MLAHYQSILRETENRARKALRTQNCQPDSPYCGAFTQPDGVYQAKYAIYQVASLIAVYVNPESMFYHDEQALASLLKGLDYVERVQHENGLFDYVTCNFFSAPDTAFCIVKLIPHLQYLRKQSRLDENEALILSRIEKIIHLGGRGLLEGGFHTPNHRWAIASVLAICGKLFDEPELTQAAFQYLNEGIDCNADGEYAEKSAGNYNSVNNDAMLLLAEGLEDDAFEQHVIRNLRMMLTYWEPDDSVFTANSTRFDKDRLVYPQAYYIEYLMMGVKYQIPEFIAMANYIMHIVETRHVEAPDVLIDLMNHPELAAYEADACQTPDSYRVFYQDSGIARVRKGRYTYTVMRGKSNFLYVHNGSIKLAVKIGGSFCEHRAFKAETMTQDETGAFRLHQTMRGWYYLPFKEKPATSDWWQMDNASRDKKLGPDMDIDVCIREKDGALELDVRTSGVEGAPWRVEMAFSGIARISNPHMTMPVNGDEVLVLRDSFFEVSNAEDRMEVGPAFGVHHFTEGKEDSEVKTPGAATVYLTDYTAFHHVITIRP